MTASDLLNRLFMAVLTLLGVAVIVFCLLRIVPGDPIAMMISPSATQADIAALRAHYGLDLGLPQQFGIWFMDVLKGNFGTSISQRRDVMELIGERLPATLELTLAAVVGAALIGIPAGIYAGYRPDGFAAKAIMTTDTYPKVATRSSTIDGVTVTINGIAKGAGMIAPDMATMLSFVVTDAAISSSALQALLSAGVEPSFNSITVDSDTSTSDTLLLFATGAAAADGQATVESADDARLAGFKAALNDLLKDLALQVVRDGEGARKMVEVTVTGAVSDESAKRIALSIANSPLVKTAVAGEDANWGRVVMAVGKSGEMADRDKLAIWFGDIRVAVDGERDPDYSEAATTAVMEKEDIAIRADIGLGNGKATVYTCDLTKEYVAINGDYRS